MLYRINDKGNVYKIPLDKTDHLEKIGLNIEEVILNINSKGLHVDKDNDITVCLINNGTF